MNNQRISLLFASLFTTLLVAQNAAADRHQFRPYVNYDLLCESAEGLQYVAHELKDCFAREFRRSGYYGKLVSKSNRIKHVAKRIHRRGQTRSTCNWRSEIQVLDDLVCELSDIVDKSLYYNRGCDPICPLTVRKVRLLLRKADYFVNALESSMRQIEYTNGASCYRPRPITREPLRYNEVAPAYAPRSEFNQRSQLPTHRGPYSRYPDREFRNPFAARGF